MADLLPQPQGQLEPKVACPGHDRRQSSRGVCVCVYVCVRACRGDFRCSSLAVKEQWLILGPDDRIHLPVHFRHTESKHVKGSIMGAGVDLVA